MKTAIIEASNAFNWGKFLVGELDEEWLRQPGFPQDRTAYAKAAGIVPQLLHAVGWTGNHRLVLDLQTGEGGLFLVSPHGYPKADLEKHKIWVCPLFEPFLEWLYQQPRQGMGLGLDLNKLPATVRLPDAPAALAGHRRPGPFTEKGKAGAEQGEPGPPPECVNPAPEARP